MASNTQNQLRHYKNATFILTGACAILLAAVLVLSLLLANSYRSPSSSGEPYSPVFVISDDNHEAWDNDKDLDIFYNDEFGSNTIAPGSKGTYTFKLENQSPDQMTYSINLDEVNDYDIALKYRLKRDGYSIVDDWSRTEAFVCDGLTIEGRSSQEFSLEWWWDESVSDENDTLAGSSNAIYTLSIKLSGYITIYEDVEEE